MQIAAAADRRSGHPLAKSIIKYADELNLVYTEPSSFEDIKGKGVKAIVDGHAILLGNKTLMDEQNVKLSGLSQNLSDTAIYLSSNQNLLAVIYMSDAIKPGVKETIDRLRKSGIQHIIMLTGDN